MNKNYLLILAGIVFVLFLNDFLKIVSRLLPRRQECRECGHSYYSYRKYPINRPADCKKCGQKAVVSLHRKQIRLY